MDFDLDAYEEGEWFYFFGSHIDVNTGNVIYDEPEKDARVKIRSMAPFIEQQLLKRKRQVEHVLNPKTRAMERVSYFPEPPVNEMMSEREDTWDYVIVDFEGFVDKKTKQKIECTRENKIQMMKVPIFDRFIARCLQIISDSGVQLQEQEEKNLSTGSSSAMSNLDPE